MRDSLLVLITIAVTALATTSSVAQTKTGTTVGQFLLIEPSARLAAMGNAGVTTFDEVTAAFYNPGAAARMGHSDVQFTHSPWLADISYNYAAASVNLGTNHALMVSLTSLDSGDINVRTVEQPLGTGEKYEVRNLALGLGYSRRVTDRFSAGLRASYVRETIWHSTMSALALDFGVLYELPFRAYIGASLSNFGTRGGFSGRDLRIRFDQDDDKHGDNSNLPGALHTEDFPLPIFFRVGIGVPVTLSASNELLLLVDAFHPADNTESISLGGEWTFMDTFSARAGYQNLFEQDSESGLTLGGGLNYEIARFGFRFDYAWANHGRIGDVQRFTVGFSY